MLNRIIWQEERRVLRYGDDRRAAPVRDCRGAALRGDGAGAHDAPAHRPQTQRHRPLQGGPSQGGTIFKILFFVTFISLFDNDGIYYLNFASL